MKAYLSFYLDSFLYGIIPVVFFAALSCYAAVRVARYFGISKKDIVLTALAFSMVGATTGIFVGASQSSVVSAVVPAFLTFVSGLAAYQYSRSETADPKWQNILPLATGCLFLSAIGTGTFGASMRAHSEQTNRNYEEWKMQYEKVQLPLNLEQLRKHLDAQPGATPPAK